MSMKTVMIVVFISHCFSYLHSLIVKMSFCEEFKYVYHTAPYSGDFAEPQWLLHMNIWS